MGGGFGGFDLPSSVSGVGHLPQHSVRALGSHAGHAAILRQHPFDLIHGNLPNPPDEGATMPRHILQAISPSMMT
jgi:hypothetical protein